MSNRRVTWRLALDRVKERVMNGSNNPLIRARLEFGNEMHAKLQSDRGCHEKEVTQGSGRLGGMTRIERESGCIALASGGAYLQTTLAPTDAVPEALVRFLEPVQHP